MKTAKEWWEWFEGSMSVERLAEVQRDAVESAALILDREAKECDLHGTDHFCDLFGCDSMDEVAAKIRELKPCQSPSVAEVGSEENEVT